MGFAARQYLRDFRIVVFLSIVAQIAALSIGVLGPAAAVFAAVLGMGGASAVARVWTSKIAHQTNAEGFDDAWACSGIAFSCAVMAVLAPFIVYSDASNPDWLIKTVAIIGLAASINALSATAKVFKVLAGAASHAPHSSRKIAMEESLLNAGVMLVGGAVLMSCAINLIVPVIAVLQVLAIAGMVLWAAN